MQRTRTKVNPALVRRSTSPASSTPCGWPGIASQGELVEADRARPGDGVRPWCSSCGADGWVRVADRDEAPCRAGRRGGRAHRPPAGAPGRSTKGPACSSVPGSNRATVRLVATSIGGRSARGRGRAPSRRGPDAAMRGAAKPVWMSSSRDLGAGRDGRPARWGWASRRSWRATGAWCSGPTSAGAPCRCGRRLGATLGVPVVVDNDTKAAALAERLFGAARDARDFVVIAGHSGVGGARAPRRPAVRGAGGYRGRARPRDRRARGTRVRLRRPRLPGGVPLGERARRPSCASAGWPSDGYAGVAAAAADGGSGARWRSRTRWATCWAGSPPTSSTSSTRRCWCWPGRCRTWCRTYLPASSARSRARAGAPSRPRARWSCRARSRGRDDGGRGPGDGGRARGLPAAWTDEGGRGDVRAASRAGGRLGPGQCPATCSSASWPATCGRWRADCVGSRRPTGGAHALGGRTRRARRPRAAAARRRAPGAPRRRRHRRPGVGKSTLGDRLVEVWRARGERVGGAGGRPVEPLHGGGALLGDRVRMTRWAGDVRRVRALDGQPRAHRRAGAGGARRARAARGVRLRRRAPRDRGRRPGRGGRRRGRRHRRRGAGPGPGRRRPGGQGRSDGDRRRLRARPRPTGPTPRGWRARCATRSACDAVGRRPRVGPRLVVRSPPVRPPRLRPRSVPTPASPALAGRDRGARAPPADAAAEGRRAARRRFEVLVRRRGAAAGSAALDARPAERWDGRWTVAGRSMRSRPSLEAGSRLGSRGASARRSADARGPARLAPWSMPSTRGASTRSTTATST